jgi:hypothetical protein
VYLGFISDITNERDASISLELMRQSFTKRNKDKRVSTQGLFEGSGRHPVQWDFRGEALVSYAAAKYGFGPPK